MTNDVNHSKNEVNTMDQDILLGVTMTITQAGLPYLRAEGRLGEYAVVYRVHRHQMGGGFGNQDKHPFAWAVLVYVDGQVARINSARGFGREWSDLDRLERWLRDQGFWYWWTRNDLEQIGQNMEVDEERRNIPAEFPNAGGKETQEPS